jgi:hypothetical protein
MPSSLPSPEYLHVLLNHVPLTGLIVASLGLLLSLVIRSASAQVCALVLVLVCAASAWPVYVTGKGAYRHIRRIADEAGMDYLDEHLDRADHFTIVYLPAALSALAGLIIPRFRRTARLPLAWATLGCAVAAIAAGLYISEAGGKVRHPEFRTGPPASLM